MRRQLKGDTLGVLLQGAEMTKTDDKRLRTSRQSATFFDQSEPVCVKIVAASAPQITTDGRVSEVGVSFEGFKKTSSGASHFRGGRPFHR